VRIDKPVNQSTEAAIPPAAGAPPLARAWVYLGALIVGYIGVYLCRRNFSVAIPLLQEHFDASRAEIGTIASVSTAAYAAGKFIFGPLIDRYGGRGSFLLALCGVACFGALGAFATSVLVLTVLYSGNRLACSAGWGGMVKLVPDWFPARLLPFAMALLSLSFVFGGVIATMFAGQIAEWSGNNWRAVMGVPSIVLVLLIVVMVLVLPRAAHGSSAPPAAGAEPVELAPVKGSAYARLKELARIRKFWIVLGLSFILTLFRETFSTWTVDFIKTEGGEEVSTRIAAFLSTPFDALGAVGILFLGWVFGRISSGQRSLLLLAMLSVLAVIVWSLPNLFQHGRLAVMVAVGAIGFLSYGPYSLLAGILAVEIRGPAYVATVAGMVDGVGYVASILAGRQFGQLVDAGGYQLGFQVLAGLALAAAVLSLFLYERKERSELAHG
jgi:sugar phosphate permease